VDGAIATSGNDELSAALGTLILLAYLVGHLKLPFCNIIGFSLKPVKNLFTHNLGGDFP
jgi:hypothetical protein